MQARNRGMVLLVAICLAASLFVVVGLNGFRPLEAAAAESGNTLYVGGSGPGNYSSILAAVHAAGSGDTVFVYSGTYYETVVVDKTINLLGEDRGITVIDGGGSGDVVRVIADQVTISGFTVQNSGSGWSDVGIKCDRVQHCHIENTIVSGNTGGIFLDYSSSCTVSGTAISNTDTYGIYLKSSSSCTITGTIMVDSGLVVDGDTVDYWNTHSIDTSVTVNGKPVYYWKDITGGTVIGGAGQVILANCTDVEVENQDVSNGTLGIGLGFSSHCTLTNITASDNTHGGIYLYRSSYCTITDTTITNNDYCAISLHYSNTTTITNTTITNNDYGVFLWHSDHCALTHATISNNGDGISMYSSSNCAICYNNIYGNRKYGVRDLYSGSAYMADATYNWWGSADGPSGVGPGSGDAVSNNIIYEPWQTNLILRQHTLTTSVDPSSSGLITLDPPGGTYNTGVVVTVTASPASGYIFDCWSGDAPGTSTSIQVTMNAGKSLTAHFIPIPMYSLTTSVNPAGSGTVTRTPSGGTYNLGTVVTLTASESTGFQFSHWSGHASGTSISIQVTMTENKSITAHFVTEPYPPPENEPPTVLLSTPPDGSTVSGTIIILGSASDNDGTVQNVEIKIGNGLWQMATGTTNWTYSWDTATVSNGDHTISTRSYDGTDYSESATIRVSVNNNHVNQAPTVAIVMPTMGTTLVQTFIFTGTASDPDGNDTVQLVELKVGDGSWVVVNGTTSWNYAWDSTTVDNGDHVIQVRAYDGLAHSDIDSVTITVKNEEDDGRFPGFEFIPLLAAVALAVALIRKSHRRV